MNRVNSIGYTTGVFDLFHIGHLNILKRAKQQCDYLVVGVSTDELVYKLKGRMPIIPFNERVEIVNSIKYVDEVIPEITDDKIVAYEQIKFDKIFKGDDWRGTEKWNYLENEFRSRGIQIIYFSYTSHTSSTKLREILENILDK